MDEHELSHFELVRGDDTITLKKKGVEQVSVAQAIPAVAPLATPAVAPVVASSSPSETETETDDSPKDYIDSPMVGTFYRSPDPESDPFIKVGDFVEEGMTVCIIESMKVMNEIKAEKRGKITAILADDTKPIQYGEHLFSIDPS